jgi:hypothetical protein
MAVVRFSASRLHFIGERELGQASSARTRCDLKLALRAGAFHRSTRRLDLGAWQSSCQRRAQRTGLAAESQPERRETGVPPGPSRMRPVRPMGGAWASITEITGWCLHPGANGGRGRGIRSRKVAASPVPSIERRDRAGRRSIILAPCSVFFPITPAWGSITIRAGERITTSRRHRRPGRISDGPPLR